MTSAISARPGDTPANIVLDAILSDRTRHPCLASILYQLTEKFEIDEPDLASRCWKDVTNILSGYSGPGVVRRLAYRHGCGNSAEAHAFHRALLYLIDQDELHRDAYLAMSMRDRRSFIAQRLDKARDMSIEYDIAL